MFINNLCRVMVELKVVGVYIISYQGNIITAEIILVMNIKTFLPVITILVKVNIRLRLDEPCLLYLITGIHLEQQCQEIMCFRGIYFI